MILSRHVVPALIAAGLLGAVPDTAQAQAEPPTVTVAAAGLRDVTAGESFVGRVEAVDRVNLLARAAGFLTEVAVADGATVTEGDVLFRIERDQYEALLATREADLARAEANLDLSEIELARREQLVARNATPQAELDVARANARAAEANVAAARAAVRIAELDLSYTEITAPFDGQIGRVQRSVGDLVGPSSGPLATLIRQHPIFVAFSVGERQMTTLQQDGVTSASSDVLPVFVDLPNGTVLDETGRIAFTDNRINPATGTMSVRAQFDNAAALLIDGGFVTVRIEAAEPTPTLVVPQAAIQRDQRGDFVLVVGPAQQVEQRYVELGTTVGTERIVRDGLSEGETVIVEGLQRVRPGVPVRAVLAGTQE